MAIEGPSDGGDAGALEFSLGVEPLAMLVVEAENRLAMPGREISEAERQFAAGSGPSRFARAIRGRL